MKKVIIITHMPFWQRSSGDKARLLALAEFLDERTALTIGYIGEPEQNEKTSSFQMVFFGKGGNSPVQEIIAAVKQYMASNTFDVCIVEHTFLSFLLPYLPKNMKLILDAHDIVSERRESFKAFGIECNGIAELSRKEEYGFFRQYDHVMMMKKADFDKVGENIGVGKVILAGHPGHAQKQVTRSQARNIGFIASSYPPNVDAISWFLSDIWPHVGQSDLILRIFGSVTTEVNDRNSQNVEKVGMVADIEQIYASLDIVINPVRFGAGLKIKNIEALGHGLPLITTPHGAGGLEDGAGTAFLCSENPREFAAHIDTLVQDEIMRRTLSDEAYNYAQRVLSPESCFGTLLSKINE